MSITGLAIIYIIIWWIVFFAILPIDVNRTKTVKIDGEDPGSPENPKMIKKIPFFGRNIKRNKRWYYLVPNTAHQNNLINHKCIKPRFLSSLTSERCCVVYF